MQIDGKTQKYIQEIRSEFKIRWSYILLVVFATIIATLGLLANNVSVIIGSMLISPLFWPILGISLSVVVPDKKLTHDALYSSFISLVLVLATSFIVTALFPFSEPSQEILARTNPTLTDLSIALAVSVIGVLAIRYKNISQTATGVAISIALLPVLCVIGISIAFGSWEIFVGSFLLFLANAGAIIFIGATLMYFMGVQRRRITKEMRWNKKYITSFIFLLILAIPLTLHLFTLIDQQQKTKQITTHLTEGVSAISDLARTDSVSVIFPPTFSDDAVAVEATIYLPKSVVFSAADEQALIIAISEVAEDDIDLKLDLINTVSVQHDDDTTLKEKRKNVRDLVYSEIAHIDEAIVVSSVFTIFPESDENSEKSVEDDKALILVSINHFGDTAPITFDQKQDLSDKIAESLDLPNDLTIELDPITLVQEESENQKMHKQMENVVMQDLATLSQEASLIDVSSSAMEQDSSDDGDSTENASENSAELNVSAQLLVPNGIIVTQAFKNALKEHLQEEIGRNVNLTLQVVYFADI